MRFNLRPLANIQASVLRAFSPNQEYIVLGYVSQDQDIDHYVHWIQTYSFLTKAITEFMEQNKGLGLVPFVLPIMNSYDPYTGLVNAENKICKDMILVVERHINNELDEIGDIAYTLETVVNSLNAGLRIMQYGTVLNPTRRQIKERGLNYLDLLPFNLNPT